MPASALPDLSRSVLPNLTPLIDQFASKRDCGFTRMTKTPTKASQSGMAFTASVIANSKFVRESEIRSSNNLETGSQTMTRHTAKHDVNQIGRANKDDIVHENLRSVPEIMDLRLLRSMHVKYYGRWFGGCRTRTATAVGSPRGNVSRSSDQSMMSKTLLA